MTTLSDNRAIEREGVRFVESILKQCNARYVKIDGNNDIGNDCLIEVLPNEKVKVFIMAQIKSGVSFVNRRKTMPTQCEIPVEQHYEYWLNNQFPEIGIVYDPIDKKAYWTDIKRHLKTLGNVNKIKFLASLENEFSIASFKNVIIPLSRSKDELKNLLSDYLQDQDKHIVRDFFRMTCHMNSILLQTILECSNINEYFDRLGWMLVSNQNHDFLKQKYTMGTMMGDYDYNDIVKATRCAV